MSGSNVKSKLSINKDCWNMGFQILKNEYMQDIDQQRFSLQNTFKSYLKNHVLADKDRQDFFRGYLKYMSILSRQILNSIKFFQQLEFNPYIVNSSIDHGLWGQPDGMKYELIFDDESLKTFSKDHMLDNAINFFWMHEGNFQEIMEQHKLSAIFGKLKEDDEVVVYLDEISMNIASIFMMHKRYKQAEEYIEKATMISQNNGLKRIEAKLLLLLVSMQLDRNIFNDVEENLRKANEYFGDLNIQEGVGESLFLQAVYHIKMLEYYRNKELQQQVPIQDQAMSLD